jgi:hypothetical protein
MRKTFSDAQSREESRDWLRVHQYFPEGLGNVFFDARTLAETLPPIASPPQQSDAQAVAAYGQRERSMGRQGGWLAVCCFLIPALLITVADWRGTAGGVAWVAICMCWPTIIAWYAGKTIAEKRARQIEERRKAVEIVAKAIRYERQVFGWKPAGATSRYKSRRYSDEKGIRPKLVQGPTIKVLMS